jgi:hypothetical protein
MTLEPFKRKLCDHFLGAALGIGAAFPALPLIHRLAELSGSSPAANSDFEGALGLAAMYLGYNLMSKGFAVLRVGMNNLRVEVKESVVPTDRTDFQTHIPQPK